MFKHIKSTFSDMCIAAPTILFSVKICATREAAVLPLALLPMLPSMLELPFCPFGFLIGRFCFLLEVSKGIFLFCHN